MQQPRKPTPSPLASPQKIPANSLSLLEEASNGNIPAHGIRNAVAAFQQLANPKTNPGGHEKFKLLAGLTGSDIESQNYRSLGKFNEFTKDKVQEMAGWMVYVINNYEGKVPATEPLPLPTGFDQESENNFGEGTR